MPPPPPKAPKCPIFGVLQALQLAVCNAQCPHPWGHAPESQCPKPSPCQKNSLWQSQIISTLGALLSAQLKFAPLVLGLWSSPSRARHVQALLAKFDRGECRKRR